MPALKDKATLKLLFWKGIILKHGQETDNIII